MDILQKSFVDFRKAYQYIIRQPGIQLSPNFFYSALLLRVPKKFIVDDSMGHTLSVHLDNNMPVLTVNAVYFSGKCECVSPKFTTIQDFPQYQQYYEKAKEVTGKDQFVSHCKKCRRNREEISLKHKAGLLIHEMQHITHGHLTSMNDIVSSDLLNKVNNSENIIDKMNLKIRLDMINYAMDASINQYNSLNPPGGADYLIIKDAKPFEPYQKYYNLLLQNSNTSQVPQLSATITPSPLSNPEISKSNIKEILRSTALQTKKETHPPEVTEILHQFELSNANQWKRQLQNWSKAAYNLQIEYNWKREHIFFDDLYPSLSKSQSFEFDIFSDSSGSITDTIYKEFMDQIFTIKSLFACVINFHQWDTKIHHSETLIDQTPKLIRHTKGSTDVSCVLEYAQQYRKKNIIILTDGYFNPVNFGNINVLWAYTQQHQKHDNGKYIVLQ